MACTIQDLAVTFGANNSPIAVPLAQITVAPTTQPLFILGSGIWRLFASHITRVIAADVHGVWSIVLPWPSETDPTANEWSITLPDGSKWQGFIPEGQAGPFTIHELKNTYGWGLVTARIPAVVPTAIQGLKGDQGIQGPAGTGIPLSGVQFAVLMENPVGVLSWTKLSPTMFIPTFEVLTFNFASVTSPVELGTIITNPAFTASYLRPPSSATINDGSGAHAILTPFTSFGYGVGSIPPATYQKTTLTGSVLFTLQGTETSTGGVAQLTLQVDWEPRNYFGLSTIPGSYNQAFIKGLSGSALTSSSTGTFSYGAGGGTLYAHLCVPAGFAAPTHFINTVTLVPIPVTKVASAVALTNTVGGGFSVPGGYDVYRADNPYFSAFNMQVS